MRARVPLLLTAVITGGGVVGACSSSHASSSASPVTITAANVSFSPTDIKLNAGQKATFTVKNDDNIKHNLTIEGLKVDKDVDPGKSASATVTLKAGSYAFHCEYHPQQMKGTITVG